MAKNKGVEVPETYQIRLSMSVSPHIKSRDDVPRIMRDVVIALVPAALGAIFYFRAGAALVMAVCIMSCLVTEYLCSKFLFGQRVVIDDWSAVICGLLLAFTLPPGLPLWIAAIGGACAIFFGKAVFGGLGQNIFNPALVGRAILLASWPVAMTTWKAPASAVDAVTSATPLGLVKESAAHAAATLPRYTDLLLGNVSGSLGETSALLLLLGAGYLFYRKIITWHIPVPFIATVFILSIFTRNPLYEILSGGLMLGAFFMATDMVTSPVTPRGRIIFGAMCGGLTWLIRNYGGYPEGVCYAILIMNSVAPLIDRYTIPREFGAKKEAAA